MTIGGIAGLTWLGTRGGSKASAIDDLKAKSKEEADFSRSRAIFQAARNALCSPHAGHREGTGSSLQNSKRALKREVPCISTGCWPA
jgi:hypothetical protein